MEITVSNQPGGIAGFVLGPVFVLMFTVSQVSVAGHACDADLDANGSVEASDLAIMLAAWGSDVSNADLDRDGQVSGSDVALLLTSWGECLDRDVVIQGIVHSPDGEPHGAAVVSDGDGAITVTNLAGYFELACRVERSDRSVELRAESFEGGRAYSGSSTVHVPSGARAVDAGYLIAYPLDSCEDYRWSVGPGSSGGANGWIRAMISCPFASDALVVAGQFTEIGGRQAARLARWDGSSWLPLGSGVNDTVWCLEVFDDGNGPALYAAGSFTTAGGVSANRIARWDGTSWGSLGDGLGDGGVRALAVFDNGSGPALYAAGWFTLAGGREASRIAKWDGKDWQSLAGGLDGGIYALEVLEGPDRSLLVAGGVFESADGEPASRLAAWNGRHWQEFGQASGAVYALEVDRSDNSQVLFAGGDFEAINGVPMGRLASWDGSQWSALGEGADLPVWALTCATVGGTRRLLAGGLFDWIGGIPASSVAVWNGEVWQALGDGLTWRVDAISVLPPKTSGRGPRLIVGGWFSGYIAEWECEIPNRAE